MCNFAAHTVDGSVTETRTLKGDTLASYKKDPREHESPEDATEYAKEVVEAKRKRGYQDAAEAHRTTTHKLLELEDSDDDSQDFESPKKRKKSSHKDKKKKSHRDKKHKKKKSHRERERD